MDDILLPSPQNLESRKHHGESEMEDISPRSRRDLESLKHHDDDISTILMRSRQSQRVLSNLSEMEDILPRFRILQT